MMKLVVFICAHLSFVLSMSDANSHPLLFESNKDVDSVSQSKITVPESPKNLKDTGYASNCGKPDHNFTLSWDPKVVNPSRGVVFHLAMVAASGFTSGTVEVSVYTGGSKDPFISDTMPLNCGIIHSKFPQMKCPVAKGDKINLQYDVPDLTALPPGTYTLKADVQDTKEKDFLCAKLEVEIKE